jgi:exonuclease SbcC
MKIKTVEIQAFRAYDKLEDATFDFTTKKGTIADFVAIYAPNGFGKTSFYDAVEWGLTNNINRFLRKKNENINASKAEKNRYILRHNKSDNKTESFVKINTDDNKKVFERKLNHKIRSNQRDTKFDESLTDQKNVYLLDVMLSQENIAAFLKEDDSNLRYMKFINSFGDKELDQKYKMLLDVISINNQRIKKQKNRLKELKDLLSTDVDREILSKINTKISTVNKKGIGLLQVTANFSKNDDAQLQLKTIDAIRKYEASINNINDRVNVINQFIESSSFEVLSKLESYKTNLSKINYNIEKNKISLSNIDKLKKRKLKVISISNTLDSILEKEREIETILENYNTFHNLRKNIISYKSKINKLNFIIQSNNEIVSKSSMKVRELKINKKSLLDKKNLLSSNLEKAVKKYFEHRLNIDNIKLHKYELEQTQQSIDNLKNDKNKLESDIVNLMSYESDIQGRFYKGTILNEYPELKDLFYELVDANNKLPSILKKITEIEEKLKKSENLDSNIKNLVEIGASIISKNEMNTCPLCSTPFDDFNSLLKSINLNELLSDNIKNLVDIKSKLEYKLALTKTKINNSESTILDIITSNLRVKRHELKNNNIIRVECIKRRQDQEIKLRSLQSVIDYFNSETKGLSLNDYEEQMNNDIDDIEKVISNTDEEIDQYENSLNKTLELNKVNNSSIQVADKLISQYQEDQSIVIATKYFNSISEKKVTDSSLIELKNEINIEKTNQILLKTSIEREVEELSSLYHSVDENIINKDIQNKKTESNSISNKIEIVHEFIKNTLNISVGDASSELLPLILNSKKESLNKINEIRTYIANLNTIDDFRKKIIPFLRHKQYTDEYALVRDNLNILTGIVSDKLEMEKKGISTFIDKHIKSFFSQML